MRAGRSPPPFRLEHRLSDWPNCQLELQCCRGATVCDCWRDRTFAVCCAPAVVVVASDWQKSWKHIGRAL
jgi:hypothetical protein